MIGALSIVCGVALLYLLYGKNEKYSALLHPERHTITALLGVLLLLLGGAEIIVTAKLIAATEAVLLVIRIIIGITSFFLFWVIRVGLIQSSALLMAILIIIRALMLHFGYNP